MMKILSDISSFPQRMILLTRLVGNKEKFARLAGISAVMIGKYESGRSEPGRDKLVAIANATGVSMAWLVTGEGAMYGADNAEQDGGSLARTVAEGGQIHLQHDHDFINRIWKKYLAGLDVAEELMLSQSEAELLVTYRSFATDEERQAIRNFMIERFLEGHEGK